MIIDKIYILYTINAKGVLKRGIKYMIIDKAEFKSLLKDGGGKFKALHTMAFIEYYEGLKVGASFNLYILDNCILGDIALGEKICINYNYIKDIDVINNNKLKFILEDLEGEKEVVFKLTSKIEKIYNTIRQNANLGYKEIERKTLGQQLGEVKNQFVEEVKYNIENKQIEPKPVKEKKPTKRARVKQLKKDHIPYCPKCHSTSLQYVERRKQLSVTRGIVGNTIGAIVAPGLAPAGTVIGALSSKKYKGYMKCLNCGHTWQK